MRRDKNTLWIRIYIIAICIIRTLLLLLAGINGFSKYFPRVQADYNLILSTVLLIMFWLIAIFFESINPFFIWVTFLLDGIMSYFCGMGIYRQYKSMSIYECIYFGNIIFIIIDVFLIVYLVNMEYKIKEEKH